MRREGEKEQNKKKGTGRKEQNTKRTKINTEQESKGRRKSYKK